MSDEIVIEIITKQINNLQQWKEKILEAANINTPEKRLIELASDKSVRRVVCRNPKIPLWLKKVIEEKEEKVDDDENEG